MVPLDFREGNFGLCCLDPFLEVPSTSLAEPDLDDDGMLSRSSSVDGLDHAGVLSVTGSGIDERSSSLRSRSSIGAIVTCVVVQHVVWLSKRR